MHPYLIKQWLGLLGFLAGRLARGRQPFYSVNIHTSTLPKPYTVCFIRQVTHAKVIITGRLPLPILPLRDGGLCDPEEFSKLCL